MPVIMVTQASLKKRWIRVFNVVSPLLAHWDIVAGSKFSLEIKMLFNYNLVPTTFYGGGGGGGRAHPPIKKRYEYLGTRLTLLK